jgi:adenylate kinase family enzyme
MGANRVVILGRGGAGKSTLARTLGASSGLPVIELDQHFWDAALGPTPPDKWVRLQKEFAAPERWVGHGWRSGALRSHWVRLRRADTVIFLDFPLPLCAWRAFRRGSEKADFWRWVLAWRWTSRPRLMREIATHAKHARVHVLRSPRALARFLEQGFLAQERAAAHPPA